MAFVIPPHNNFITGPGGLDALLRDMSPTPELLDHADPPDLSDQEQYKRDLVTCLRRVWDHESVANFDRWDRIGRAWELVNNNYANPGDPDLSDLRLPEALMLVQQVTGVIMAMFEQSQDWWEAKTKIPSKQCYVNLVKDLVNDHIDNPRCKFWKIVEEGLQSLIITGHVNTMVAVKYGDTLQLGQGGPKDDEPEDTEPESALFGLFDKAPEGSDKPFIPNNRLPLLHFRNIPSECVNKDSSSENLYHTWSIDVPVGLVFLNADKMGWDKDALIRAKDKGYLGAGSVESFVTTARLDRPRSLDKANSRLMRLTFHEGHLPDLDTGALLYENKYMVMANECEIVYGPAEIPWWDGGRTLIDAPFMALAHEVYGKGLVSENVDTLTMSANMLNQMLDYMNEAFCGAYEYDQDRMRNEAQRTNLKLHPRMMIPVEGGDAATSPPVVRRLPMGEVANSAWQVGQALDMRKSNALATGSLGGSPRPRGRMTTQETNARQASDNTMWRNIFRNIQNNWLSPLLQLGFLRLLQSYPRDLWKKYVTSKCEQLLSNDQSLTPEKKAKWKQAYDALANMSKEEVYAELGSTFNFSVHVLGNTMERQGRVEKGAFLIRNLAVIPGLLEKTVNMNEWTRQMVIDLGYDPEKILLKAGLEPPSPDTPTPTALKPGVPFEDDGDSVPDVSGGALPSMNISGGVFPGGPVSDSPGIPGPPPM